MLPTKREQAPPVTPGKLESSRQRLATLFAGFNPFASPDKPAPRGSLSPYELNANPVLPYHRDLMPKKRSPWRGKTCLIDLPDELIVQILSFLPPDQNHLIIASWVDRRLNQLVDTPVLWSNLLDNTPGPVLAIDHKEREATTTPPGSWTSSGVWTPATDIDPNIGDKINYRTLFQSRRLLDRVVRGRPLKGAPHVDTLKFTAPIYCVYASGPWLILGSKDRSLQVWRTSVGNNDMIKMVEDAHEGSVLALAVDAWTEGAKVITGSSDGTAGVWDLTWGPAEEQAIGTVVGTGRAIGTEAAGTGEGTGPRWNVDITRKETLRGHTAPVLDVALARDFVITCSKDTTIRIYRRDDYSLVRAIVGLHSGPVNCLALHPDPDIPEFISASGDGFWVRGPIEFPTFFARHQTIDHLQNGGQALACVAWGGPLIVTGSKNASLRAYNTSGDGLFELKRHTDSVRAIDLDVNEAGEGTIVSASYDRSVVLWDAHTGQERYVFTPHSSIVLDVQLTNGRLITASHDQTVQIRTFGVDLPYRHLFV